MIKNYLKLLVALVFATNVMAQNIPSYVPKDGLVGWWPFNGNANDESGNGNNGTVNGATLTSDRNGKPNCAYDFDGVDDKIEFTSDNFTNLQFSISIWINNQSSDKLSAIIGKSNWEDAKSESFLIENSNSNEIGYGIKGISCEESKWNSVRVNKNSNFDNKWQHLLLINDGGFTKIYFNSSLVKQTTIIYKNINCLGGQIKIGAWWKNDNMWFNGKLDDIAIYNRALSDQEVKQLYAGCTKETATSKSFNSYAFTNNSSINLAATPTGGTFSGNAVTNNAFNPSKAKLGKNQVKYTFKNSTGCADSTNFEMIMVDTLGNKCSTYDTLKIKVQLTTGIKSGQVATMNVYPNPTSDIIIIEASDVGALNGYSYKMVDLQGKQVYKEQVTKAKTEISLKSIGAKGVYILHVLDAQGVSIENKKIVLE
jgi:hypothetical protein